MPSPALILTAIGNEYGYEQVFSRRLEGLSLARHGITTSGNSPNVVLAYAPRPERP